MITKKLAFLATTALVGNVFGAGVAFAQSTGSAAVDVIVITGDRLPQDVGGMISAETVAKTRTTINQEFIETQTPGQTILQTLSIVTPGLNFTNNDPYGTSGGNIRLHGFDGNRVALTFDGMPLNDTGNYAVFTNQLLDGELIASAQVNTGSTDVDSPTAASTGGTINFASRNPGTEFGAWAQSSMGDFMYQRHMLFVESGEVGPWGTRAWGAVSYQNYDKFKGEGEIYKRQVNFKIYQPLEGDDFVSLAAHWNVNRNNSYFGPNLPNATGTIPGQVTTDPRGYEFDFNPTYAPIAVTAPLGALPGDVDNDPAANSSYWGLRINPSNTGNIRIQSRFDIGDAITITLDPSFQYVLANGGTQNINVWESCNGATTSASAASCPVLTRQLIGAPFAATSGVDLNVDSDLNDFVRVMNPSNTNTRRYGFLSSLIFRINEDHLLRASYTLDYGRHRQTGEFSYINPDHTYKNPFGGKDGHGVKIRTVDGSFMRNRDRFSIATLNQFAGEYRGNYMDDKLNVSLGLRMPFFERELNQYCFSQNGTSNVRCTTEVPNATLANGNVTFTGATTQYIAPYQKTLEFDDLLPNVGASYFIGDSQLYASYAESTSLPRTDNIYTVFRLPDGSIGNPTVQPETSATVETGYRYERGGVVFSGSAWWTSFQNRIVSSFDQDTGLFIDRNVGEVRQNGVDAAIGWEVMDNLMAYGSVSIGDSEVQSDVQVTATTFAPTKGRKLAETPIETYSVRIEYEPIEFVRLGAQAKHVGARFATDTNDLEVPDYTVVDIDGSWDLDMFGFEGSSIRVNVINLFDVDYFGSIGSTTTQTPGLPGYSATGRSFANVGSPRTYTVTLRAAY